MAKKKAQVQVQVLTKLPVVFGKVTFGEGSLSIPIRIDRTAIPIDAADQMFVGRRLTCQLSIEGDKQQKLAGFDEESVPDPIDSVAESKKLSVGKKHLGATLNFLLEGLDDAQAAHFANKTGTLSVMQVEDLPEAKRGRPPKGGDDEDGEEDEE
jgi:hypothetical protein